MLGRYQFAIGYAVCVSYREEAAVRPSRFLKTLTGQGLCHGRRCVWKRAGEWFTRMGTG